jgi:predicted nucleic acid-binding protein
VIVVSDTSPITSLLTIGRIDLLQTLFGTVIIPPSVNEELVRYHVSLPSFIEIKEIQRKEDVSALADTLGLGEAEAIVLAQELKADLLLIDEKLGRGVAEQRGIRIIGLAGVLLLGKDRGVLSSVKEMLAALETQAGFYLAEDVKLAVLDSAGESRK